MVFWINAVIRVLYATEDYIVGQILRRPGFHNAVRRIHRRVQDHQHGRDPGEPLRPGEATELGGSNDNGGFMKHFLDELRNQARGTPTDVPPPPRGPQPPRK